jgi:alpha-beta hydrolase superfamily lysophospholipase
LPAARTLALLPLVVLLLLLAAGCAGAAGGGGPGPAAAAPTAAWAPPTAPRAVIVALHGFSDHKGAFAEFGAYAAERGVAVAAYDQPGFGERADRGRWGGTEALASELAAAVRAERGRHPGVPLFVLGESMGAAVAVAALARPGAPAVDGVVLAAPAVWDSGELPRGYLTVLRLVAALVPPLAVSGGGLGYVASDNVEALRALGRDPLYLRRARVDAVAGLVDLMDEARRRGPELGLPVLALLGARDQIVPATAFRSFVANLRASPACSVVAYLDGWHLLLRDHQRRRVFDDVLAWTGGKPPPSRLDRPCVPAAQA